MRAKILVLAFLFTVAGCTTGLWQKPAYTENLTGFYLAEKENRLIAAGEKYAYATVVDEEFKKAIYLHEEIDMRLRLHHFEVDRNNKFSARLILYAKKRPQDLTKEELDKLADAGFTQKTTASHHSWIKNLSGNRYILEGELQGTPFKNKHSVYIREPHSYTTMAKKMVVTPFTLAFDTFVVAPSIVFYFTFKALRSYRLI